MARRRYYRRYRRRPRKYVRRWFKRKTRRFINGSTKSICRLKVPVLVKTTVASVDDDGVILNMPITPWATARSDGSLLNRFSALASPLYRQFTYLYDEVKCIGGKFMISIETPVGTATIPSVTMITAWDRRYSNAAGADDTPTFDDLITYSTAKRAVGINNSVCKIKRSLYASDLMEKAQWHDCTISDASGTISDRAVNQAGSNPNFFIPACWLGLSQSGAQASDLNIIVEGAWYFAFRNPKYSGSATSGSKRMELGGDLMDDEVVEHQDTLDLEIEQAAPTAKKARFAN